MRFIKRLDIRLDRMLGRTGPYQPLVWFVALWLLGMGGIIVASSLVKGIIALLTWVIAH